MRNSNDQKFEFGLNGINTQKPNFAEQIILSEITTSLNSVYDNQEYQNIGGDLNMERLQQLNKSLNN